MKVWFFRKRDVFFHRDTKTSRCVHTKQIKTVVGERGKPEVRFQRIPSDILLKPQWRTLSCSEEPETQLTESNSHSEHLETPQGSF